MPCPIFVSLSFLDRLLLSHSDSGRFEYYTERDFICNYIGIRNWSLDLDWPGQAAFQARELAPWHSEGAIAGMTRTEGPLTYLTVRESSHFVPYSRPRASLEMFNAWVHQRGVPE